MLNYVMSAKAKSAYEDFASSIATCEQLRVDGKAYAGKDEQLDTCKAKAREVNKIMMADIIGQYVELAKENPVAVMENYFQNWYFTGYKVVQDSAEDGNSVHEDTTNVRIQFSAIDTASKTVKLTTNGAWKKYLQIFVHNCILFNASAEKGETYLAAVDTLPAELSDKRKEIGWTAYATKAELARQFNELVAMVMPEAMKTVMLKSDLRAFIGAVSDLKKATSMDNAGINFAVKNVRSLEEILFRCILTRRNNLAVKYDMGYKQDKSDKGAEGGAITGGESEQAVEQAVDEATAEK